jgi:squalene-hopene cyclase-like protein
MSFDLTIQYVNKYIQETTNFLLSKISRDPRASPPIAGWHNFFTPNRIGTTGSAVPLIFLNKVGVNFHLHAEVINKLVHSQQSEGCWAILSLDVPTVEGTTWPLRALALAGGDGPARQAVNDAEEWLLSQQKPEGAWGSTRQSPPRTLPTIICLESLAVLTTPPREQINNAIIWLSNGQRRDGSWGEERGQDGTVTHTALACHALLIAGLPPTHPRIADALSYLKLNWKPNSKNFQDEKYEVHFNGGYNRVSLEHDVDAAVIQALLRARPAWASEMILKAVDGMINLYLKEGKLSPANSLPSIWNIIPRATAFHDLLNNFPVSEEGRIVMIDKAIVYSPSPSQLNKRSLSMLLVRHIIIPRFPWTTGLFLLFIAITVAIMVLYVRGSIQLKDVLLSLGVECAGLSLGVFIESKIKR